MTHLLLDTARQYHAWGANVNAIGRGKKSPIHPWKELHTRRQELAELEAYSWKSAAGVGVNNGPGGWHTFDIDAVKIDKQPIVVSNAAIDTLLAALGLPDDYAWVWRGQSQSGWALAFRCDEALPSGVLPASKEAGVAWGWPAKDSGADWHHLELRYERCQTVCPPSTRYTWRHAAPSEAPALLPIHRVLSAFFTLCPPQPHSLGSIDRATIEQIKNSFDLIAYATKYFGGEIERAGHEVRITGHGGLLIDPARRIWHNFSDDIGGDALDLIAFNRYRTTARNLNGKSPEVLAEAAEWAGVALPERAPTQPLTRALAPAERDASDDRPRIGVRDLDIPQIVAPAWDALIEENEPPTLFRRDNMLYELARGDEGELQLIEVDKRRLRGRLARVAVFEDSRERHDQVVSWVVDPPSVVLDDMLVRIDPRVPLISRITRCPVILADGTIVATQGYHAAARVYYDPRPGLVVPAIPAQPSAAQIAAARDLILIDMLGEFPFVSEADRAHAVALLLLPFARELIAGPTPLHMIEAPTPGSGKTLLASVLMRPSLGVDATPITEGRDDAEWQKKITSVLASSPAAVLIDNVNKPLMGSALSAALTSTVHSDRLLGTNTMTRYPIRCAWLATANNPTMSGEVARRAIRIRVDAKVDQPWKRDGFKHPNLLAWVREHEGALIAAALTLIRAGLQADTPALPPLGSFEHWTATIGGILHAAGIGGFLQNLDELYDRADTEGAAWRALISAWWEKHQKGVVGSNDVFELFKTGDYEITIDGKDEKAQRASFGRRLRKRQDQVIGGYQVIHAGEKQRTQQWQLRPVSRYVNQSEVCEVCEVFTPQPTHMGEHTRTVVDGDGEGRSMHGAGAVAKTSQTSQTSLIPPLPAYAIWHGPDTDEPVTVVRVLGEHAGVLYLAIEGSQTGIPADEVEFFEEETTHGSSIHSPRQ